MGIGKFTKQLTAISLAVPAVVDGVKALPHRKMQHLPANAIPKEKERVVTAKEGMEKENKET